MRAVAGAVRGADIARIQGGHRIEDSGAGAAGNAASHSRKVGLVPSCSNRFAPTAASLPRCAVGRHLGNPRGEDPFPGEGLPGALPSPEAANPFPGLGPAPFKRCR